MQLKRLFLRGFIGIKKGLGLDEIELDFSNLSGLIALSGPNGHGKSTILENLQPFRTLASRDKALGHHCFLRDSVKELEFTFNGDEYKTVVKIDAENEKQEGYIYRNGESLTTGKVREYDKVITDIFGTSTLFFNSVFCAQNATKLSELTTGDLKKLFSEFLRLDKIMQYEATAKQAAIVLQAKADGLKEQADAAQEKAKTLNEFRNQKADFERQLADKKTELAGLKDHEKAIDADLKAEHEKAKNNEISENRIADLNKTVSDMHKSYQGEKTETEQALENLREEIKRACAEIKELEKALERADEISRAVADVARLKKQDADLREQIETVQLRDGENSQHISKLDLERTRLENELKGLSNDSRLSELKSDLRAAKEKTADLKKKDPACTSKICSFIVGALEAEKRIPEIEAAIKQRTEEIDKAGDELSDKIRGIEKEIGRGERLQKGDQSLMHDLKNEFQKTANAMAQAEKIAADKSKIDIAAGRISELKKQKEEITKRGVAMKEKWQQREADIQAKIKGIDAEIDAESKKIVPADTADMEAARAELLSQIIAIEEDQNNLNRLMALVERDIADAEKAVAQHKELAEKQAALIQDVSEWRYLQNACSKDGLRALEIDSVAPIISQYANDLLSQTFGPNYSVAFRTQDPESGREILDIYVIREDGSEVLLDNLSGGEKVWSLKALRLAMTLISKQKSGKNFMTCLSDEEDGALDKENAQSFINLYQAFMRSGGFESCFYISHRPECVGMADNVMEFKKGGITIN